MSRSLIVRLSGPLASFGEQSRFYTRGTLDEPTYSALLGMISSSLGYGRKDNRKKILKNLDIHVRVDHNGHFLRDYHTVNNRDVRSYQRGFPNLKNTEYNRIKTAVHNGSGSGWGNTLLTDRHYRSGACYVVAISGKDDLLDAVQHALVEPVWQQSLGRKGCIPDWPLYFCSLQSSAQDVLAIFPRVSDEEIVVSAYTWNPEVGTPGEIRLDNPIGSSPTEGYTPKQRYMYSVTPPAVNSRSKLIEWSQENSQ